MIKRLSFIVFAILVSSGVSSVKAQDDLELGGLPPIPDLDMGNPREKKGLFQKAKENREATDRRYEENVYTRSAEDGPAPTFTQRMGKALKGRPQSQEPENMILVPNKINSDDNALTASGSLLRPFGEEENYWGPEMMQAEDPLAILPPLPDLRTPDQVSKKERYRDLRLAKFEARKAEQEAKQKAKELEEMATVDLPPQDPDTALIQVQSNSSYQGNYIGNMEQPETPNKSKLKPFNEGSSYYKDNQVVYRGGTPVYPVEAWWRRGTNPGQPDPSDSKFRWMNPFGVGKKGAPEMVAYRKENLPTQHSAGSQTYTDGNPGLDSTLLTSNLQGILVVRSTSEVDKTGRVGANGIETRYVDLPKRVHTVFESRLGQSLTLGGLNQMVREAVIAYRKSDMPVVDVLVPEQEVTSGVLQLVVIEGRLGDVIVEGVSNRESSLLAGQIHMDRGEVIHESQLLEDLAWINKHPTRKVDLIYSPGTGYGETDIILRSEAYRAISAYLAYENSGTTLLGEDRVVFGASWTGPAFLDLNSIFSYQFTTNLDRSDSSLYGHSGVFATYLPWQHQLTMLGAYTSSEAVFNTGAGSFLSGGSNKQLSTRYAIPLDTFGRFTHEFEMGIDFKQSDSDLAFNNAQVFDTTSEIVQFALGYNILTRDRTGSWTVDVEVITSPGNKTDNNTDAIFRSQRAFAEAEYTYGRILIERDQQLPDGWSLFGRLQGQFSGSNLLASETLGAGGYDSVRGFEQRIIRGDRGIVGNVELRTPTVFPSNFGGFNNVQDIARGVLFYDHAALSSEIPLPGEVDRSIGSVGVGWRYQLEDWFTFRLDYGVQVSENGVNDGQSDRWHIGARATF